MSDITLAQAYDEGLESISVRMDLFSDGKGDWGYACIDEAVWISGTLVASCRWRFDNAPPIFPEKFSRSFLLIEGEDKKPQMRWHGIAGFGPQVDTEVELRRVEVIPGA